jgi:hypothetical protein
MGMLWMMDALEGRLLNEENVKGGERTKGGAADRRMKRQWMPYGDATLTQ